MVKRILLNLFILLSGISIAYAGNFKTGWLQKNSKGYVYFKPYIKVKYNRNLLAIFITSKGKVYKGKCRLKREMPTCTITPGKKFESPFNEIRYILLEIDHPLPPKIVKTGTIGEKIIKE
ncbi:hypothetical protein [Desulfurobacterium atlanticum]|uniref:Uncharacterized protein n=1 Tax=Desulfurobacterium atlanticum TaxID=240169 RepID=A0A239A8R9_9BACT|nr:hypothetical protein [Desulfurobacterium atlanticum]SNR92007.1 hypothetical protein SAMN06265340_1171 [Desulfurobacterium atlanticum]